MLSKLSLWKRSAAVKQTQGVPNVKNVRHEALDRLSRLGAGLSPGQRNDWAWFKNEWHAKMFSIHKGGWPNTFSEMLQAMVAEPGSNAFSVFVHDEALRVLSKDVALQIPGT